MAHPRQVWFPLCSFLLLAAVAARADELTGEHTPETTEVLVTWHGASGETQASGSSHALEWSRLTLACGDSEVRFRVPVASFSSDNAELDAKVSQAIEAKRFPFLQLAGTIHEAHFEGSLTIHGVTRPLSMEISLSQRGQTLTTRASIPIDVRDFGMTFDEAGPLVVLELFARLPVNPQVVVSGGAVLASR